MTRRACLRCGICCNELHNDGETILLTTHYMEEADQLCDRVAITDHGRALALDTPEHSSSRSGPTSSYRADHRRPDKLGELLVKDVAGVARSRAADGRLEPHVQGIDRPVPRIVLAAEHGGFDLLDVSVAEPSLETVFIDLTGRELREE